MAYLISGRCIQQPQKDFAYYHIKRARQKDFAYYHSKRARALHGPLAEKEIGALQKKQLQKLIRDLTPEERQALQVDHVLPNVSFFIFDAGMLGNKGATCQFSLLF